MPAWRSESINPPPLGVECVVILIGLSRRDDPTADAPGRCLHAYGVRGASALCGAADWRELVPPAETTCPTCRAWLERKAMLRVH